MEGNYKKWLNRINAKQDRLQDTTGSIGIGKSDASATEKLDVNGNVKATGFIIPNGTANQALTANGGVFDLKTKVEELTDIGSETTSIIDTDVFLKKESGGLWRKITWVNIKANLKTYFDSIYTTSSAVASQITTAIDNIPSNKTTFTHDILVSNWSLVSGKYEAVISNVGILADSFVDIIPSNDNVDIVRDAQIYPSVLISEGSVKVYSKFLPSGIISVTVNII